MKKQAMYRFRRQVKKYKLHNKVRTFKIILDYSFLKKSNNLTYKSLTKVFGYKLNLYMTNCTYLKIKDEKFDLTKHVDTLDCKNENEDLCFKSFFTDPIYEKFLYGLGSLKYKVTDKVKFFILKGNEYKFLN